MPVPTSASAARPSTIKPPSKSPEQRPTACSRITWDCRGRIKRFATATSSAASANRSTSIRSPSRRNNNVYNILDGSGGKAPNYGFIAQPGYSYAQAADFDRENVVNLHIGIPHRDSPLRDDVQLLYVTGGIAAQFYSSANDIGYTPAVGEKTGIGYPMPYLDSLYYGGAADAGAQCEGRRDRLLSQQPGGRAPGSPIDPSNRDGNYNGYSIEKLQYQKNFDSHSYLRALSTASIRIGSSTGRTARSSSSVRIPPITKCSSMVTAPA